MVSLRGSSSLPWPIEAVKCYEFFIFDTLTIALAKESGYTNPLHKKMPSLYIREKAQLYRNGWGINFRR